MARAQILALSWGLFAIGWTEPAGNFTNLASSTSAAPPSSELPQSSIPIAKTGKTSKFFGIKDKKDRKPSSGTPFPPPATDVVEAPVIIVEPLLISRPCTRSERPLASAPDSLHSSSQFYSSTSSTSRIGDLPTRLSGWFSDTFSSSSTDIASPPAYHSTAFQKRKGPKFCFTYDCKAWQGSLK
jgi:cysteine protease ATG4